MNIQVGISKSDLQLSSNEVVHHGEFESGVEFTDFLLLSPSTPPLDQQNYSLALGQWFATSDLAPTDSFVLPAVLDAQASGPTFSSSLLQSAVPLKMRGEQSQHLEAVSHRPLSDPVLLPLPTLTSFKDIPVPIQQPLIESVSQQTIHAIESSLVRSEHRSLHSITVSIHPQDLGQLNIQIEMVADAIQARIVASENLSAELLNRNKQELINALSEFGYSQTDVDISHQNAGRKIPGIRISRPLTACSLISQCQTKQTQTVIASCSSASTWWLKRRNNMDALTATTASSDYLSLLSVQLQNQDPIDPVDQGQLVNDLTQFSILEGIQNLNATFDQVLQLQELTQGIDLVGKEVQFVDPQSGEAATGIAERMTNVNGAIKISVGNQSVNLSDVISISQSSS